MAIILAALASTLSASSLRCKALRAFAYGCKVSGNNITSPSFLVLLSSKVIACSKTDAASPYFRSAKKVLPSQLWQFAKECLLPALERWPAANSFTLQPVYLAQY
ncbi:hypothetical protein BH11CYA1_BH11CYA1_28530 [soil metagenome]